MDITNSTNAANNHPEQCSAAAEKNNLSVEATHKVTIAVDNTINSFTSSPANPNYTLNVPFSSIMT